MIHLQTLGNPGARRQGYVHRHVARVAALAALLAFHSPVAAEDERGRWTFSFGGGVLSTNDDIRSNAAVVDLRDQGRPGDISDDPVDPESVDPRQDDLLGRETSVEEVQTYQFSAAYGLTPWLSVQVDLGYYKGDISNLDSFRIERRWADLNDDREFDAARELFATPLRDASSPITAGELQQIPLTFSAIFRFRRDSPFNPILGAGVGWVFTDLAESQALADLNTAILDGFQRTQIFGGASNIQIIEDAHGNQIVNTDCAKPANEIGQPDLACEHAFTFIENQVEAAKADGTYYPGFEDDLYRAIAETYPAALNTAFIPTRPLITAEVDGGFAYQLLGGAEYHFNDRWSVYVLGRYLATKANLSIRIRDNGNLFTAQPVNPGTETVVPVRFDLKEALFRFNASANVSGGPQLEDSISVQGGDINLSSFSLIFGLRYTF